MKVFYKGFDLTVRNGKHYEEKKTIRVSKAVRRDDSWELAFYPSQGTTSEEIASMKKQVDGFYKRPDLHDAPALKKTYEPAPVRRKKKVADEEEE
jgi:hypothetical protein